MKRHATEAGENEEATRTRSDARRARRIRTIARLLDDSFRVPGTRLRFGFDSLVGLIPGVGDAATTLVSLYLVHEARQLGVPTRTLFKMAANTGIDLVIGSVPLIGDLADFGFKANRRNVRLIDRHLNRFE